MASWINQARNYVGKTIAGLGQAINAPRVGTPNSQGIGAFIAGQSNPFVQKVRAEDLRGSGTGYIPTITGSSGNKPTVGFQNLPTNPTPTGGISGGGGGGGGNNPPPGEPTNPPDNTGNALDDVERKYQDYISMIGGQEQDLRNQLPVAEQKIQSYYQPERTATENTRKNKLAGLDTSAQTVETQKQSQMQQARDLYRQVQQQNVAQLSGMGISSSSVAEALAETLGVETARRIGSTVQSADDVIRNINQERVRVNEFADQQLKDLEGKVAAALDDNKARFDQSISQLNQARQLAASDKASRRADIMQQAANNAYAIQQSAQQFQQALDMWKAQTDSKLSGLASQDFSQFFNNLTNAIPAMKTFNIGAGNAGMQTDYSFAPGGKVSVGLKPKEEEIANPFQ